MCAFFCFLFPIIGPRAIFSLQCGAGKTAKTLTSPTAGYIYRNTPARHQAHAPVLRLAQHPSSYQQQQQPERHTVRSRHPSSCPICDRNASTTTPAPPPSPPLQSCRMWGEKALLRVELHPPTSSSSSSSDATTFFFSFAGRTRPQVDNDDNRAIYRFTALPVGFVCSPFLLAPTVACHLQQAKYTTGRADSAQPIHFDTRVLTAASSVQQQQQVVLHDIYQESKKLFANASTSLPESLHRSIFTTNSQEPTVEATECRPRQD